MPNRAKASAPGYRRAQRCTAPDAQARWRIPVISDVVGDAFLFEKTSQVSQKLPGRRPTAARPPDQRLSDTRMCGHALGFLGAVAFVTWSSVPVGAQAPTIKIGVLYDHTGPFAAAGSLNCWRGAKMMIDYINEKGGVLGKYKIVQVDGDRQSKAEVAINEAERLLNVEKVDILAGVYSSAHAVPLAEKVDKQKKFLWITTAIADAVFEGPEPPVHVPAAAQRRTLRRLSVRLHRRLRAGQAQEGAQGLCGWPSSTRTAPYGADVAAANEAEAKKLGMQVVLKEGYSISAPDLSSLVTKLRAARPDVLFHTGYNPDIAPVPAPGQGAGAAGAGLRRPRRRPQPARQAEGDVRQGRRGLPHRGSARLAAHRPQEAQAGRGRDDRGDGAALQGAVRAGHPGRQHRAARVDGLQQHVDPAQRRAAAGDPQARRLRPDALAKAARETDIPEGGTMQGYGVKFYPVGHRFAGQNERAFPAVFEIIEGKFEIVCPKTAATSAPILPLPASSPLAIH